MSKKWSASAYKLDGFLRQFENKSLVVEDFEDELIINKIKKIRSLISVIEPIKEVHEDTWTFWIEVPCGSLEESLKEAAKEERCLPEEIESECKADWEYRYLGESFKWYQLSLRSLNYQPEFILAFDRYFVMLKNDALRGANRLFKEQRLLLSFLAKRLKEILDAIVQGPDLYNKMLENRLSKTRRFGRIKRCDYLATVKNARRLDKEIGKRKMQKFAKIVSIIEQEHPIEKMTADDFFRFCEICYDANKRYSGSKEWTAKEKYKRYADGRDEGLTVIKGSSEASFRKWFHSKRWGGHPWEICAGGSTTHISLRVSEENKQWHLQLAGESLAKVVETVNMALALHKRGIPFQLAGAKEIFKMVSGQDYIGIVANGSGTKYCDDAFPEEDNIIDFMDPWWEESFENFKPSIYWYPLIPYRLLGLK